MGWGFIGSIAGAVKSGVSKIASPAIGGVKLISKGVVGTAKVAAKVSVGGAKGIIGGAKIVGSGAKAVAGTSVGKSLIKYGSIAGATVIGGPAAGIAAERGLSALNAVKDKYDDVQAIRNQVNEVKGALTPAKMTGIAAHKVTAPKAVLAKRAPAAKGNLSQAEIDAGKSGSAQLGKVSEAPAGSLQDTGSGFQVAGMSAGAVAAVAAIGYLALKK